MMFFNLLDQINRLELIMIVIDKYTTFSNPLTIELTPHCLTPAGICYCKMETALLNLLPVRSSNNVSKRIKIVMRNQLWMACSS